MKSLADQLREQMTKAADKPADDKSKPAVGNRNTKEKRPNSHPEATILQQLTEYDNSDHKTMVHFRFDKQTVDFLNKFKIATGIDATKFVAFAVKNFVAANPELKTIIKKFIQNTEL